MYTSIYRSYQDNKKAKGKDQAFFDKIDEPNQDRDEDGWQGASFKLR